MSKMTTGTYRRTRAQLAYLDELRAFIADCPWKMDMETASIDPHCRSAGCIIGHWRLMELVKAKRVWRTNRSYDGDGFRWTPKTGKAELLYLQIGLTEDTGERLCFSAQDKSGDLVALDTITKAAVLATLARLRKDPSAVYYDTPSRPSS